MSKLFKAGVVTIAAGTAPLLIVIAAGPADSNPVGLGLLMVLSMVVGTALFIIAGLKALFR